MGNILDTHTLIWYFKQDAQLSPKAKKEIEKPNADNFVSMASLWEMAIKISIKKLNIKGQLDDFIKDVERVGFTILPIQKSDILIVESLPLHHRDPFDRLIISQAFNNNLENVVRL